MLLTGEKLRVLTVLDVHTRESLALVPQRTFRGGDVGGVRSVGGAMRGQLAPTIQADQGTACTAVALEQWAYWNKVSLAFSRPATPGDNAHGAACNGTRRREVLSQHWFASLAEAAHLLETWRAEYNNHRPHRSFGNQPPAHWATGGAYDPSRARLSG